MLASHQGANVNFTVAHLKFDEVDPASFYTEDIAFSDSCFGNVWNSYRKRLRQMSK